MCRRLPPQRRSAGKDGENINQKNVDQKNVDQKKQKGEAPKERGVQM
jgi:hypothetical protein